MFPRTITHFFESWKKQPSRKPLVVRGARQVGKTTVIKEFGNQFDLFIYLNLELLADRRLFELDLSVTECLQINCYSGFVKKRNPMQKLIM
jgi:predicted AAA+ superfamily ATPase